MKPERIDLEMWSDSTFDETIKVILNGFPQDFAGWEFKAIGAVNLTDETPAITFEVIPEAGGSLRLRLLTTAMPQFTAQDQVSKKVFNWVLKAKPNVTYPIRLAYGTITLNRGLMPWPSP